LKLEPNLDPEPERCVNTGPEYGLVHYNLITEWANKSTESV